jgi:hypothetical protein
MRGKRWLTNEAKIEHEVTAKIVDQRDQAERLAGLRPLGKPIPKDYPVYEVSAVNRFEVGIFCHNHADPVFRPTFDHQGNTTKLILSCGR